MTAPTQHPRNDRLLEALASFAATAPLALDATVLNAAKAAVIDTFAVALGALDHPAAVVARRYAKNAPLAEGAAVWGSGQRVTAETATLINGVPLRGYDYNDFYMSTSGGHPSDIIPGLFALAETAGASGLALLQAIALGYELTLNLLDAIDVDTQHWDYPTLTAIGAAGAASRLLGLDATQTAEAIAITVAFHMPSDEVESGDLNARGDLTMWKRFNGSNAVRQAVSAALLAEAGAEGAVRPFEGKSGFLSKVDTTPAAMEKLFARLAQNGPLSRVTETRFKRWPVGSRGQSAIQAALQACAGVDDIWQAQEVRIACDRDVYEHLLGRRADPWHPVSRETADHSLPYIVAAALFDGGVRPDSFDQDKVLDARRQEFVNARFQVEASDELSQGSAGGYLSRVEIVDRAGRRQVGEAKAPPGHPRNPLAKADFDAKFEENVVPVYGAERARQLLDTLWSLDTAKDVRAVTALTAR